MAAKQGNLSIVSENIFPIIKKWLYSDHDIFYRELISNGCDAVTKLKKLDAAGEYALPEGYKPRIDVVVNPEEKTIKVSDNGIGMTADEVEEYITQIAFSGAAEFLEKYKDKTNEDQIIGHFGLGFYSSFMVADEVHIDTLSFEEGAVPVHWECDGGTTYTIDEGGRTEVGTTVTLFLNNNSYEFSNEYRAREVLEKYCSFMPFEIYLTNANAPQELNADSEDGEKEEKAPVPVNDIHPLWTKHPNDCEKDEYIAFYRKVFNDYKEPLFWIHLNMDYPFNLKGILYFPKINTEYDSIEGVIKLYNNQVFIADNIKEVIPDYLMLLKGVIDCPDLPLNVSRSALQNDGFVKKISDYISKKVADKLSGMCKNEREEYEKYWDDLDPFIKFGCLKDDKFCGRMQDYVLLKDIYGEYATLDEYLKKLKGEGGDGAAESTDSAEEQTAAPEEEAASSSEEKEPEKATIYYVTDEKQQSQYINLFMDQDLNAALLTHNIDAPFITLLEQKNEKVSFKRIDTGLSEEFKEDVSEDEQKELEEKGEQITDIVKKALNNETLTVKVEKLKNEDVASMITLSEEAHRMQEMMKMYGISESDMSMYGSDATLILNANHPLVQFIVEHKRAKAVPVICQQLYDLAMLTHRQLSPDEMTAFVRRSNDIMMLLTK